MSMKVYQVEGIRHQAVVFAAPRREETANVLAEQIREEMKHRNDARGRKSIAGVSAQWLADRQRSRGRCNTSRTKANDR